MMIGKIFETTHIMKQVLEVGMLEFSHPFVWAEALIFNRNWVVENTKGVAFRRKQ